MSTTNAEIYDRGYRVYDGPRTGVSTARRSVAIVSIQRALGLRRKFRFKIVPIITIFVAFAPAIVFVGLAVVLPTELAEGLTVDFGSFWGLTSIAVILFSAFVTPELLISDRRTGMFGVYMASPLGRGHYVAAKLRALITVISTVTVLPPVFLLTGYVLVGIGPDGFGETVLDLLRILFVGLSIALYFSLFGMAVATVTNRVGVASAVIIMSFLASGFVTTALVEAADAPDWVSAFALPALPIDLSARVFDEPSNQIQDVSGVFSIGVFAVVMVVSAAVIWFGHQRIEVTK